MGISDFVDQELADRGVGDVTPADALRAWELASRFDLGYAAVVRAVGAPAGAPLPILDEMAAEADGAEPADDPVEGLVGLDPAEQRARLVEQVAELIGAELKLPAADLDVRRPLVDLGLDSVMTLAIRRGLERRFRLNLPATLLWNRPTASAVADHLLDELADRLADRLTQEHDT
jgi:6-methylsalicylic acid synthase